MEAQRNYTHENKQTVEPNPLVSDSKCPAWKLKIWSNFFEVFLSLSLAILPGGNLNNTLEILDFCLEIKSKRTYTDERARVSPEYKQSLLWNPIWTRCSSLNFASPKILLSQLRKSGCTLLQRLRVLATTNVNSRFFLSLRKTEFSGGSTYPIVARLGSVNGKSVR